MKDSQLLTHMLMHLYKYIKANNERFSTTVYVFVDRVLSISRRIMKDSQRIHDRSVWTVKYIKANNERFSTRAAWLGLRA